MEVSNINNSNNAAESRVYGYRNYGNNGCCTQNSVSFKGLAGTQNVLKWVANNFSSPHQRAILGITALCTQPFIDLHNRHIKKEDKPITVAKTIAKIIVGTIVGIALRYYAIKAIKNFTKTVKAGKYSQCLLPQEIVAKLNVNPASVPEQDLLNYRNGLGTFIGVMGGLFTNFLIDAPLSRKLTNLIHDNVFKKEKANEH